MNRNLFKDAYIVGVNDGLTLREERKIGHNLDASSLKHLTEYLGYLETYPRIAFSVFF